MSEQRPKSGLRNKPGDGYSHHALNGVLFLIVNLSLIATFIQMGLGKGMGFTTFLAIAALTIAIALWI